MAEILFNRLLHREAFDFSRISAVVMDEFHSFADPERGIVWELSLGLLAAARPHAALVGHGGQRGEFIVWLRNRHQRRLELVEGNERKVPLTFQWVPDKLLNEQIEEMAEGDDDVAPDAGPGLLLQPRRVLDGRPSSSRASSCSPPGQQAQLVERAERARLVARGRAEAQAAPAARRRRPPRGRAAQVPADRRRSVPAEAALGRGLHRDAFGGHQPAGPHRRAAELIKGPPGKKKLIEASIGPPDLRPGRPAAVRQAGLRLRAGPRGRRADRPLARTVRPDPRGHQGPRPAEGEEGTEAEDAAAAARPSSIGTRPSSRSCGPRRPASSTARGRCPGGCWPTCSTPRRKWT